MSRFFSGAKRLFAVTAALFSFCVLPYVAQTSVSMHDVMTSLPGGPLPGQKRVHQRHRCGRT